MGLRLVTLWEDTFFWPPACIIVLWLGGIACSSCYSPSEGQEFNWTICGNSSVFEVLQIEVFYGLSTLFSQQKDGTILNYSRYMILWELANEIDLVKPSVAEYCWLMAMYLIVHDVLTFGWKEIPKCWWAYEVCLSGKVFLHVIPTLLKLLASLLAAHSKKHLILKPWQRHGN